MIISNRDQEILRALAAQQMELAHSREMDQLRKQWRAHGDFAAASRPMVRIELWTFEQDVLPERMRCQGEDARAVERRLLTNMAGHTLFGDDTLVPAHWGVTPRLRFVPFGLAVKRQETGGVGHHFVPYLSDLAKDIGVLGESRFSVDEEGAAREMEEMDALFGDLLPVKRTGYSLTCCPMQDLVHIMNMDDLYVAMMDEPELFSQVLGRLVDDYIAFFRELEAKGLLRTAAADQHLCQGSYCFTDELPDEKEGAALGEMWLYMDSQETSGVSPAMFEELVFPAYKKLMDLAGRISYGCCESVSGIWDGCLSKVANLKKVSVSPWCDEEKIGQRLRGRDIVYLRKPSPNLLGVGAELDEDAVRAHIAATARAARGCRLEIAQRDVYQIHGTPAKVARYVQLIRETLEKEFR